ncbi:hypothetical protein LUZ60_010994 [Juncus effusus]|nr:hypothetical protein LUZ60_010994 [Juncus effusus]
MATLLTLLSEKKRSLISVFLFASFLALLFFSDSLNPFSSSVSAPRKNLSFNSSSPPPVQAQIPSDQPLDGGGAEEGENRDEVFSLEWEICAVGKGLQAADYIPCLDNVKAIKALKSRKRMEHRERHCPSSSPRCLVPFPKGYREPVPWPQSRDMIWYSNVPHPKLVEYKKDQNWVRKSGDYLIFPGGGTQFKEGISNYINFIQQIHPSIKWGIKTRTVLDVGCGVATFGGALMQKDVITMSFAPKDEHEAQIQFALERGIPALLSVIGTTELAFPDNSFDMVHCARCRVHWDADGGQPLLELNRVLRPGGVFVWSATPVYRKNEKDQSIWNSMVALTESLCWKTVVKSTKSNGIGVVIYQKPTSNNCYIYRKAPGLLPLCEKRDSPILPWYSPLETCIKQINENSKDSDWPVSWPERLYKVKSSFISEEKFNEDGNSWKEIVNDIYLRNLGINWSSIRNVMDMNAGFGAFAAALNDMPIWVMNVVQLNQMDTLPIIYNRGLLGVYHDWCESFNTYPRTYDLIHSSFLFQNLTSRCDMVEVVVEMDRILRPGKWVLVQDELIILKKVKGILVSLHYEINIFNQRFLVGKKGFWRPDITKRN